MKDAKGHGSDARGGSSAAAQAADKFIAAHQSGVEAAAPSQSGRDLYNTAMAAAQHDHPNAADGVYSAADLRGMQPDWDEYGDFKSESMTHPGKMYRG